MDLKNNVKMRIIQLFIIIVIFIHKLYFLVLLGGIHRILTSQTHWSLIAYMIPKQFIDNNQNIYFNSVAA